MVANSERPLDVVLFGSTGFTGAYVVEHFLSKYGDQKDIRWAIAGRNTKKLEKALRSAADAMGVRIDGASERSSKRGSKSSRASKSNSKRASSKRSSKRVVDVPAPELIFADSTDKASLMALCKRTNVVLTTVGPYGLYGDLLVDCCVECDTDYCDLTGETFWTRKVIDKHHEKCVEQGTRIVNSTGFDAIPTDCAILLACEEALKSAPSDPVVSAIYNVGRTRGSASGGTIASMFVMMKERAKGNELIDMADVDPYALCPGMSSKHRADDNYGLKLNGNGPSVVAPAWNEALGVYQGVSVMGATNTAVVRRSMFLNKYKYGEKIKIEEVQAHKGNSDAWKRNLGLLAIGLVGLVPPFRDYAEKNLVTQPGDGMSREQVEKGYFNGTAVIETKKGRKFVCKVFGERDPGYGCTSRMISETAVLLARTRLADRAGAGGVVTPASAAGLGLPLVDALRANARMTFETKEVKSNEELAKSLFA